MKKEDRLQTKGCIRAITGTKKLIEVKINWNNCPQHERRQHQRALAIEASVIKIKIVKKGKWLLYAVD